MRRDREGMRVSLLNRLQVSGQYRSSFAQRSEMEEVIKVLL